MSSECPHCGKSIVKPLQFRLMYRGGRGKTKNLKGQYFVALDKPMDKEEATEWMSRMNNKLGELVDSKTHQL